MAFLKLASFLLCLLLVFHALRDSSAHDDLGKAFIFLVLKYGHQVTEYYVYERYTPEIAISIFGFCLFQISMLHKSLLQ